MKFRFDRESRTNALLAIATGALLGLAYPPVPTGITAFAAFIPFLFLMERMKSAAQTFRFSYLAFLVLNFVTVYWISGWTGDDPWLKAAGVATNMVHPFLFTLPSLFYYYVRKHAPPHYAAFFFPFIWVSYEWLAHLPELSFPWLILANTQTYDIQKIQFITITGSFGISFWITSINALIFYGLRQSFQGTWTLKSFRLHALIGCVVLLLIVPELYSRIVMSNRPVDDVIRVGVTQPDIDPYDKWGEGETPQMKIDGHIRLYDSLVNGEHPELILMPETAIPFRILTPSYEIEWLNLRRHIDTTGTPLLTGFPHMIWYEEGQAPPSAKTVPDAGYRYDDFNSGLLILPSSDRLQIYKKTKLTPMSERIPYLNDLPFLADALTWGVGISNWGIGNDTTVFSMQRKNGETVRFWSMICYETLYPDFVAGFVRRGSNFLCVITNDGWFGPTSGPYQLKQYAVLRAIENRRGIARSANNGVSCFISPYGEVSQETALYTRTVAAGNVAVRSDLTFYTMHGDWLPKLCLAVAGMMFAFVLVQTITKRKRQLS